MTEFTIFINDRPEARRFLTLSKKNPLFKGTNPKWGARKITYSFDDPEKGKIVPDIIEAVLNEMKIEYEVL